MEDVWNAFVTYWLTVYTGYTNSIRQDPGSQLTYTRWERRAAGEGKSLIYSGVESHNSLGCGERYHGPLRRIYSKLAWNILDHCRLHPTDRSKGHERCIGSTGVSTATTGVRYTSQLVRGYIYPTGPGECMRIL